MARHEKQSFIDRSLVVDGNEYIECSFLRCELIFAGGTIPTLNGNDFDSCLWKFDGPAARAVLFMGALYSGGWQAGRRSSKPPLTVLEENHPVRGPSTRPIPPVQLATRFLSLTVSRPLPVIQCLISPGGTRLANTARASFRNSIQAVKARPTSCPCSLAHCSMTEARAHASATWSCGTAPNLSCTQAQVSTRRYATGSSQRRMVIGSVEGSVLIGVGDSGGVGAALVSVCTALPIE
jgi:hypothetical protein